MFNVQIIFYYFGLFFWCANEAFQIILLQEHKKLAALFFSLAAGKCAAIPIWGKWIHPTIGWRQDEHGTHKHAQGSWILCSVSRVRSKTIHSLDYVIKVTLHYYMLHRFEIFSPFRTFAHGSIRLPPSSLTSLRGCLLAIILQLRLP